MNAAGAARTSPKTMLSKRSLGVVLVGGVSVASVGIAQAQSGGGAAADAAAGVARQVTLSPQEQAAAAESFIARMDSSRGAVRRELETARAQRDVVKVLCLNDKLNQIDVAVRSARERKQALDAAVARNDADLANHEFTILTVLRQRSDQLATEANQCAGEEPLIIDDSSVHVTVEDVPKEDPSEYPSSDAAVEVPACSSCFK